MKKLKKLLILTMSLAICLGMIQTNPVNAINMDRIYESEIENSIISGDGSAEKPYILDPETSPSFTEYMETQVKNALNTMQSESDISTYGIMDGVLSGKSHANQTRGGYWTYKSGAPNTVSNGNIWMKSVEYISKEHAKNVFTALSVSSTKDKFLGALSSVLGSKTLSAAVSKLTVKGISKALATSLCTWLGFGGSAMAAYLTVSEIDSWVKKAPYEDAYKAKKGLISCYYMTSYQGKWYSHSLSEVWSTYPTAKEPAKYYGTGVYKSK